MWGWGRARTQQGDGRWAMPFLCVSSTWATEIILSQRRCQPTSGWCVVFCALSPGNLWKICIQISLGGTTEHSWVRELHSGEPDFIPSFVLALSVWWFLVYVPEILGQHCYCGKLWLQQHGGNEQGRSQIWVLIADCICEGGEAGRRNISLTALLVWKLNAFWELKLDVIFLSPVRECGV